MCDDMQSFSATNGRSRYAPAAYTSASHAPYADASNEPSLATDKALDVIFCAVERVAQDVFVVICTTSNWQIYRLDRFSSTRESLTPVKVAADSENLGGLIANVRFLRLFQLPGDDSSSSNSSKIERVQIGALFVSVASERCREVDYQHHHNALEDWEGEDEDSQIYNQSSEDLTVYSLTEERLLHKLPPSPSLVVDLQFNASLAAILCETNVILLYDLHKFNLVRRIETSSVAMALGSCWIAYPGFIADRDRESVHANASSDSEEVVPEAMVGGQQFGSKLETSSSYSAIDVAQNVASGLYYLSKIGRTTIAPYLSSSPGNATTTSLNTSHAMTGKRATNSYPPTRGTNSISPMQGGTSNSASSAYGGWVVVQDLVTEHVVCNFRCHSTSLVTLSFDFSGLLLATCSTKGQNLHVYRLLPPLQATHGKKRDGHQLLYKLQRGITHASIQDVAFSQDSKWINVTSSHGTSHLYAIHPEGARINADTHVNVVQEVNDADVTELMQQREVNDFYADFRTLETKTLRQVLKIRHSMSLSGMSLSFASPGLADDSSPGGSGFGSRSPSLVESALNTSQAFLSHLAQSSSTISRMDFKSAFENDTDVEVRRRRSRRRISCLFAHDGLKMVICCDRMLKLYEMKVEGTKSAGNSPATMKMSSAEHARQSKSSSAFGFSASVTELKTWELSGHSRKKAETTTGTEDRETVTSRDGSIQSKCNGKSELRTFAQRSLPLWAHPKVTFRAIDQEHPEGQVLEVKRKGPNHDNSGGDGTVNGDDQLFVLEMDTYFGIGGSPVFNGSEPDRRTPPDVPPLDLRESINMAMSSSLSAVPQKPLITNNTVCLGNNSTSSNIADTHGRSKKKKKQNGRSTIESNGTSTSSAVSSLQFTLQDMYFALPKEKTS